MIHEYLAHGSLSDHPVTWDEVRRAYEAALARTLPGFGHLKRFAAWLTRAITGARRAVTLRGTM